MDTPLCSERVWCLAVECFDKLCSPYCGFIVFVIILERFLRSGVAVKLFAREDSTGRYGRKIYWRDSLFEWFETVSGSILGILVCRVFFRF